MRIAQYRVGDCQKARAALQRVYDLVPEKDESEEYGKYYGKEDPRPFVQEADNLIDGDLRKTEPQNKRPSEGGP
ncbi:MAG: hypothetical protein H8E44_28030 [Planctomycetes bacterium]|nr:hypothetical protein [Planctomycetota bacterium]